MFDWNEFLPLAEQLGGEPDEAAQRSAISRAYYAAFHAARIYVLAKNFYPGRRRLRHDEVWRALTTDPDPRTAVIGIRGARLFETRNAADYTAQFPGKIDEKVEESIGEARSLIESVRRLT